MKLTSLSVLVIVFFVMPCIANALSVNSKDLLLYFSFNEQSEEADISLVKDLSPYGNDGRIVGPLTWVDGKYGKALDFNENGEVKAPHIPLNDKSFTVCLWVMPRFGGGSQHCIFTQAQAIEQNMNLYFRIIQGGQVRMGFFNNDLDTDDDAVKKDEWAHLCFWLDIEAGCRRIYINGKKVAEDTGKAGIAYKGTEGDTIIGSWGEYGRYFIGVIDEVQVWDRALNEKEIKESMENLMEMQAVDASGKLTTTWGDLKTQRSSGRWTFSSES